MIPFEKYKNNGNMKCSFIHGNGFPPLTYKSLLTELTNTLDITSMLLRPHWKKTTSPHKLDNWSLFVDDFIQHAKEQKIKNESDEILRNAERQRLKEWEEKFETEQRLKERKEILKDEKLRKIEEEKRLKNWGSKLTQDDKIHNEENSDNPEVNKNELN